MYKKKMGKKKGHNWKARMKNEVHVDKSHQEKIELDLPKVEGYDEANTLALPSEKRTTKVKGPAPTPVKQLSRREKNKLKKILEVKEKKTKRAELLEALQRVQVSKEELAAMQSTTQLHNRMFKRPSCTLEAENISGKANALRGSCKKRKIQDFSENDSDSSESSSSSSDDESESENGKNINDCEEETAMETTEDKDKIEEKSLNVPMATMMEEIVSKPVTNVPMATKMEETVRKPVTNVPLTRDEKIQAERLKLPILGEEQLIMETIRENMVTIICGETGSGKTTQVPQFLYEAGYALNGRRIVVTEPRRVAAISMADRVAKEMSLTHREVSYQIRYEGNVTSDTKIKFLTDGVLLKEVQKDFLLSDYSVVVLDEAHERSMYTDILIGLLSRIVPLRHKRGNPLKLIVMSATLRVEDFTQNSILFKTPPPVVKVDSRQFPVSIHFNKRTNENYVEEAFKKVCKIHKELPEGGILVFVTGQQEVYILCAKLNRAFPYDKNVKQKTKKKNTTNTSRRQRKSSQLAGEQTKELEQDVEPLPEISLDDYSVTPEDEQAEIVEDQGNNSDDNEDDVLLKAQQDSSDDEEETEKSSKTASSYSSCSEPIYTLPLYSLLSTKKQQRVFQPPPAGCRLCVVATNVAETSITIPGIKYVVDSGKTKTKFFDKVTGVSTFKVTWTSKASANQRAGRAGRTGSGHCYRLYSSAVFTHDFEMFTPPEIVRRPIEDLVLQMKAMYIDKVVNFPFPTAPSNESLKAAEDLLTALGALKVEKKGKLSMAKITGLGKTMAMFPVSPRYSKMLSLAQQGGLLVHVISLVAALSVQQLLIEPDSGSVEETSDCEDAGDEAEKEDKEKEEKGTKQQEKAKKEAEEKRKRRRHILRQIRKCLAGTGEHLLLGDLSVLLHAVGSCDQLMPGEGQEDHCNRNGIRYKAMGEFRKLRKQLTDTVNAVISDANIAVDPKIAPPSDLQCKLLRQLVVSAFGDHVAMKLPSDSVTVDGKKIRNAYKCTTTDEHVFIHPSSVMFTEQPERIIYQSLEETSKLYMKGISAIELHWLPVFAPVYCLLSKPQEEPKPTYNAKTGQVMCHRTSSFGPHSWPVPAVELQYPYGIDCFKWFATFFLDGQVCKVLEKYKKTLLALPITMTKSWARLQPRTETLLNTLTSENVHNKETLQKAWKKNPKFLLSAYKEWLPEALHQQVESKWPPKL